MADATDAKRRRIRTRVQAAVSACGVLLVIVPIALEVTENSVSPGTYAVLAACAGAIVQGATLVTRIMAQPAVATFIATYIPWMSKDG